MTRRTPEQYNWEALEFDETLMTKHFTSQSGVRKKYVVVHHAVVRDRDVNDDDALDAIYNIWQTRASSAQYGVDGRFVRQFVWDKDYAWATGSTAGNRDGISIEHVNHTIDEPGTVNDYLVSEETWKTGARLTAYIHMKHGMGRPVKDVTLRKHSSFKATACPGPFLGGTIWDEYVREAQRVYDSIVKTPGPTPPTRPTPPVLPTPTTSKLKVISWNVHITRPTGQTINEIKKLIDEQNPDVLALYEAKNLYGKLAGMGYYVAQRRPVVRVKGNQSASANIAFLVRKDLRIEHRAALLMKRFWKGPNLGLPQDPRVYRWLLVRKNGVVWKLGAFHLPFGVEARNESLVAILEWFKRTVAGRPTIGLGDYNLSKQVVQGRLASKVGAQVSGQGIDLAVHRNCRLVSASSLGKRGSDHPAMLYVYAK